MNPSPAGKIMMGTRGTIRMCTEVYKATFVSLLPQSPICGNNGGVETHGYQLPLRAGTAAAAMLAIISDACCYHGSALTTTCSAELHVILRHLSPKVM